jgi:saccharopine dehydrogenase (NAD+, L-lysine forming)
MRILVIGAGGVGGAVPAIAQRRSFFDHLVVADIDEAKARRAVEGVGEPRTAPRSRR